MSKLIFKHVSQLLNDYDLFLFDLWGVIIEDEKIYPNVIESINCIMEQKKCIFVSNVPRPAFVMKDRMQKWGLKNLTVDMIVTSGDLARAVISERAKKLKEKLMKIYHLGDDKNDEILVDFDHIVTKNYKEADIVLMSIFRDENENIREFDDLLKDIAKQSNILTICANPDIIVPRGDITRYCAGYFAKIIEQNGGDVIYTGKPKDEIYQTVFKRMGDISKDRVLMIGDSFETDIIGAQNVGIDSALVLTGNSYKYHHMYEFIDDKVAALDKKSKELNINPTFITQIN